MKWLLMALAAASLHGAVVRGVVVENLTGKPLARAVVILAPVSGAGGAERSLRAGPLGGFEFDSLPPGAYILKVSRRGFMSAEYGQKRWNSAGSPILLQEAETAFVNVRLPRYCAIAGTVVDENEIGLPDQEVVAYRMRTPPEIVARARTDDRGAYRIYGLTPGTYVVRTAGKQYEDDSYLPTFARETEKLEQARTVDVSAEQQVDHVDVRPLAGRLFSLDVAVLVIPEDEPPPVTLTLAGPLGRQTVKARGYRFTGLVAGDYDVYAEAPDPVRGGIQGVYSRISVTKDGAAKLQAQPVRESSVTLAGAPSGDSGEVWIRRKDMAGVGKAAELEITRGRALIPPGRWEVMLQPPAGYYVSGFFGPLYRPNEARADGWNEILVGGYGGMRFTLSGGSGTLHGVIKSSGEVAPWAPVYLEGWDPSAKTRIGELRSTYTDAHGQFRFEGLAPGTYRILGTFEYLDPDVETMSGAAQEVIVDGHTEQALDLELYVIR